MIEIPKLPKPSGSDNAPRWFHIAVALSMVLSAAAALVGALRTSATMSALVEQNARLVRASSTPLLQWRLSNLNAELQPVITWTVDNAGTGPAHVVWMELELEGQKLSSARQAVALMLRDQQLTPEKHKETVNNGTVTGSIEGDVLVAGRGQTLFNWVQPPERNESAYKAWRLLSRRMSDIKASACYCSVFEECWQTEFDGKLPRSVPRCDATGHTSINSRN